MTTKPKNPTESAMRDGTILGCLWTATFAVSVAMLKSLVNGQGLILSFAVLAMTLMSPYLTYKLATKHRDSERGSVISYSEAWMHIIIMYICAILLSSIVQYVFYAYIDPNMFGNLSATLLTFAQNNNIDEQNTKVLADFFNTMNNIGTGEMILSLMTGHITRDIFIATILAITVKKNS